MKPVFGPKQSSLAGDSLELGRKYKCNMGFYRLFRFGKAQ